MSIRVIHDGAIKSAIPYVRHNDEVKIPVSGWTKVDGVLKQIWPPANTVYIYNQATLEAFRDRVNEGVGGLNGKVIADFELTGEWTPIANYISDTSLQYTGTFDGGGHTIKGLTISSGNNYQGLFGYLGGGVIKDLTLEDVSVAGSSYVGAIAGRAESGITIENCAVSGSVTGSNYVGGIVGYTLLDVMITNCLNTGKVDGTTGTYAGGIVGYVMQSEITDCMNSGEIQTGTSAGGIAGLVSLGDITNCANTGNITAATRNAGGIVGFGLSAIITGCTNSGTVTAGSYSGDIVGYDDGCSIS